MTSQTDMAVTARPVVSTGPLLWARQRLFNSWLNALLTIGIGYGLIQIFIGFYRWAIGNALLFATPDQCQALEGKGACWAVIVQQGRFILFGRYIYDQQWRPALAVALFVAILVVTCFRRFWWRRLLVAWAALYVVVAVLMWGGIFGLPFVEQSLWGGLPLTLVLAVVALTFAFPFGVLLALGRRSALPVIHALSVGFIELIRGVPLVTVLFMASVMFPLFLPEGMDIDRLLRALVALTLFCSAYIAEVVRAGLQGLPRGQYEAADALGLSFWAKTRLIVLPQALRIVIPPLVGICISTFKNTSLVLVVGLFDLLTTASNTLKEPLWRTEFAEVYLFVAAIYFCFCFFMSQFSQSVERQLRRRQGP
jgi:general L-amino acid transport system permease protein